jgi:Undecaprenyl-phosphate galactose phosphotransferase WbaP
MQKSFTFSQKNSPASTCLALVACDMISLFAIGTTATLTRYVLNGQFSLSLYAGLWPLLFLFIGIFAAFGLYPGVLLTPAKELKKIWQAVSLGFVILSIILFLSKSSIMYSRWIFASSWVLCLCLCPFSRGLLRLLVARKSWWGYPAVILGGGRTGDLIASTLNLRPRLGLKVVAIFDDDPAKQGTTIQDIPVVGRIKDAMTLIPDPERYVAAVAIPGAPRNVLMHIMESYATRFLRVLVIPDLFGISSLWVKATDIGGILGLEIQHKLLDPRRQAIKRFLDVTLILMFLPLILPLVLVIALCIFIVSPGPVLFRHQRIGMGGRDITIWKFRTMVTHADTVLENYLATHPGELDEWTRLHKLTNDPRVFPLGRWLRKTSLDELPQILNVLRGDLSLVGPRPIVWEEVEPYHAGFPMYKKVKPGLTGLWQISGRSFTTYDERVDLDTYYVRNWSVWLDIYILARTPLEVILCRGAC